MRDIEQSFLDEVAKHQYVPAIFLKLSLRYDDLPPPDEVSLVDQSKNYIEEDVFYTSWTKAVGIYKPLGMEFRSIKYGTSSIVDNVTLELNDVELKIFERFEYLAPREPQRITIAAVTLTMEGAFIGSTIIWDGFVSGWTHSKGIMKVKAVSVFDRWSNLTTSKFTHSCRWKKFKGIECGYSGAETSCDRSYDTCNDIYSNKDNFGGFRWIMSSKSKPSHGGGEVKPEGGK